MRISVLICLLGLTAATSVFSQTAEESQVREARGVIERTFGAAALKDVTLSVIPSANGNDTFEFEAANGKLQVRGSSAVALSSGFYQYVKQSHIGMATWAGSRLDLSKGWPDMALKRVASPFKYRFNFNVVAYGYTMPYWTWQRWEKEIDWMALHGINMPLALVGAEAIGERVWKKLGLTQEEIDVLYTGPAHLPWERMGNIANLDGPLTANWQSKQVALQHKILDREHALGMSPIVPAFAGFVPPGLKRLYPDITLRQMAWGGFSQEYRNNILSPDAPVFSEIGKLTVSEWEAEFGKATFFLSDSFNEMEIPAEGQAEKEKLLAHYGDVIYRSIQAGDPDAVWVMQGWMFGFQRHIWSAGNVRALLSKVPNDKMIILDEAMDYNDALWKNGFNFEVFDGFHGKQWIGGYIPNMGGKCAFTGVMETYARVASQALGSPKRGRMIGMGLAPEGLENNEVLYELITDSYWQTDAVKLDEWLRNYCQARYGDANDEIIKAWNLLIEGSYRDFRDHPKYNWQVSPEKNVSSVSKDQKNIEAAKAFLAVSDRFKDNPLYRSEALEITAMALGIRADNLLLEAKADYKAGKAKEGRKKADEVISLLASIDKLLVSHPTFRLKNWIDFARAHGDTAAEKDRYEANAKLLITLWGYNGEINDYSCRVWAGLVQGYYLPRLKMYFENQDGAKHDIRAWEQQWVKTPGLKEQEPYADPLAAAKELLNK